MPTASLNVCLSGFDLESKQAAFGPPNEIAGFSAHGRRLDEHPRRLKADIMRIELKGGAR
jgi:hypothetical protein